MQKQTKDNKKLGKKKNKNLDASENQPKPQTAIINQSKLQPAKILDSSEMKKHLIGEKNQTAIKFEVFFAAIQLKNLTIT